MMHQPQIRELIHASAFLGNGVGHVQILVIIQSLVTDGTETLLLPGKLPRASGRGLGLAPPLSPVVL
jgi:hypothetical protein